MHKNQLIAAFAAVTVVAGAAGFFGGTAYGRSSFRPPAFGAGDFRGGMMGGPQGGTAGVRRAGSMTGTPFLAGEILSKDADTLTLKLRDGGSKIVRLSDKTEVGKTVTGTAADLVVGQQVTANGTSNTDGSLTAQSVQIRPATLPPVPAAK